jgi:hypothetical protein
MTLCLDQTEEDRKVNKQMKRMKREKAKTNAKENLKAKRFRDEVFDKLFSYDFLSRINKA